LKGNLLDAAYFLWKIDHEAQAEAFATRQYSSESGSEKWIARHKVYVQRLTFEGFGAQMRLSKEIIDRLKEVSKGEPT
jgi:hypothetical protein